MRARLRVLLLTVAVATTALAGCIKSADGDEPPVAPAQTNETPETNATLPDGRGESAGIKETNKTEEGVGGMDHKHDYWQGRESAVVFDDRVQLYTTPVFPDGEGTDAKSVAYVKLPNTTLVYEGTDRVTILFEDPQLHPECEIVNCDAVEVPVGAPDPSPPSFAVQVRTAADSDWREPVAVTLGTPIEMSVEAHETDMPHSVSSLWVFRVTSDRSTVDSLHMVVTAHKGRNVLDWPGHPDFYADNKTSRVVLNAHVTTHMSGIMEGLLYDGGGTWVTPEKLISYGTTRLEVFANVTRTTASVPVEATGYFLEFHNATIIGPEITFGTRLSDGDGTNDLRSYNFTIDVDPAGMDGPYQPQSRWGFRLMATFANVGVPGGPGVGICPGCYPYDIEYDVTVIAVHEPGTESRAFDR